MSIGLELKDDATREDVDAMVKEFMEERRESSKTVEDDSRKKDTSKQTTAGDDDSADDDAAKPSTADGEGSAEKPEDDKQAQAWLTDEVRAELPRWIADEDLSEFSSREELDRALGLMDRAALKAGREAGRKGDEDQGADDAGPKTRGQDDKFVKQQRKEPDADHAPAPFEIDLDLSEFDEDLGKKVKGALTGFRDHYEGRMKALDERFTTVETENQARIAEAMEARFDAIVDSLEHADLFGHSGQESEKQLEDRRKLFDEHHVYLTGLKALGRDARMDQASVSRVLRMTFAEHISKQEQKNLTQRITKQSSLRMGVGAERPAEQPFKGPLKNHPDVQREYKQLQEARGEE
jgi:hypothetical protein